MKTGKITFERLSLSKSIQLQQRARFTKLWSAVKVDLTGRVDLILEKRALSPAALNATALNATATATALSSKIAVGLLAAHVDFVYTLYLSTYWSLCSIFYTWCIRLVFAARRSNASAVLGVEILSVCLPVRPSLRRTRACDKWKNIYCRYFDTTWKVKSIILVFWHQQRLAVNAPSS